MSLTTANLRGLMDRLDLTEVRAKKQVTDTYRRIVEAIFTDIVSHTPQFTGNLASGWQIVFGPYQANPTPLFTPSEQKEAFTAYQLGAYEPYEYGDDPAVSATLDRELDKLKDIRYNSIVRIVNPVVYAEEVEAGKGPNGRKIRPENLYYGKVFMASYAEVKYGKLKNLVKIVS